jgi:hypothetical protein
MRCSPEWPTVLVNEKASTFQMINLTFTYIDIFSALFVFLKPKLLTSIHVPCIVTADILQTAGSKISEAELECE